MREAPNPVIVEWARALPPAQLTICVVTVEEIERGIWRLPHGRRRESLTQLWAELVDSFADTVLPYDLPAAQETAKILVAGQEVGRPMSLADAQIAGICRAGGHALATRNVADFAATANLSLLNPFEP